MLSIVGLNVQEAPRCGRNPRLLWCSGGCIAALLVALLGSYAYDHDSLKALPIIGRLPWRAVIGNTALQPQLRRDHAHENDLAAAKQRGPRLVFLGDSLTQHWLEEGRSVWDSEFGRLDAAAIGVGGDRTQHLLYRIRSGEFASLSPGVVTLLIGTNNVNRNDPDEIDSAVGLIVRELQRLWPAARVIVVAIPPREMPRSKEVLKRIKRTNYLLDRRFASAPRVSFIDDHDAFLGNDGWINRELYSPDGVHLTPKGYALLARLIRPAVEAALPAVQDRPSPDAQRVVQSSEQTRPR